VLSTRVGFDCAKSAELRPVASWYFFVGYDWIDGLMGCSVSDERNERLKVHEPKESPEMRGRECGMVDG
jgi:hypothetical protein